MVSHQKNISVIGRANTALDYGYGKDCRGVISTIIAKVCEQDRSDRIRFKGSSSFDEKAVQHINEVVLPVANNILKALNLPENCYELSVVNLDAASMMGVEIKISGSSADPAIFWQSFLVHYKSRFLMISYAPATLDLQMVILGW